LIATRDVVLPYRSKYGLARYQHRAIERFLRFSPDLSGTVLEIGSDVDGCVLKELSSRGIKRWSDSTSTSTRLRMRGVELR
jgi:hypothetical protein